MIVLTCQICILTRESDGLPCFAGKHACQRHARLGSLPANFDIPRVSQANDNSNHSVERFRTKTCEQ